MATQSGPRDPKSILKKPQHGTLPVSKAADDSRLRKAAVRHATIVQQRKDLEAVVLASVIALSEFPLVRASRFSASNPAPSDVTEFKSHVRLLQPTDFDDLIIERNSNNLCGYPLCPRPNNKVTSGGKWKLVNVGKQDFDIVSKAELEKWCCHDCKKRALWVRIQLNETAAWERAGIPDLQIRVFGEDERSTPEIDDTIRDLAKLQLDEKIKADNASNVLAFERGESAGSARLGLVDVTIRETLIAGIDNGKTVEEDAGGNTDDDIDDHHLLTEGYKVRFGARR
jgi:hypothetical protein